MGYNNAAEKWTREQPLRDQLFCDVAEHTHPEDEVHLSALVGNVPCIERYAPKTHREILAALAQKMAVPTWPGDRVVRVRAGIYRWLCRDWSKD